MSIFRVEKNANYTVISNYHLRDKNLSLKTIGLLSLILSLPEDWDYSQAGLAAICKDGEDSIRSGLKELEKYGYLERERERDANGRMTGIIYRIFEVPKDKKDNAVQTVTHSAEGSAKKRSKAANSSCSQETKKTAVKKSPKVPEPGLDSPTWENPVVVNPTLDTPNEDAPGLGKQPQINKDVSNTDLQSTDLTNPSIYQSKENDGLMDGPNQRRAYEELVKENVGYDLFARKAQSLNEKLDNGEIDIFDYDREFMVYNMRTVDNVIEYMLDIFTSLSNDPIAIGGELINREIIKAKLHRVDFIKLKKVVFELNTNPEIKNPKKYAISMLYNA